MFTCNICRSLDLYRDVFPFFLDIAIVKNGYTVPKLDMRSFQCTCSIVASIYTNSMLVRLFLAEKIKHFYNGHDNWSVFTPCVLFNFDAKMPLRIEKKCKSVIHVLPFFIPMLC